MSELVDEFDGEAGLDWDRSSFCNYGDCVEVAKLPHGARAVRSSRLESLFLTYTREEWAAFVAGVKAGEFDPEPAR